MSDIVHSLALATPGGSRPLATAVLRRALRQLRYGRLVFALPGGERLEQRGPHPGPDAVMEIHDSRLALALLLRGSDGLDESYIAGAWSSPDLPALLTLLAVNFAATPAPGLLAAPLRLLARLHHAANANTRAGARRNIMAHYDLGNEFYAAWLDSSMLYSSALYTAPDDTLEAAQAHKLARITRWLDVPEGGSVLEIGCGWGALAARLGGMGAHVTGLTLSPAQLAHAQTVAGDNVTLALRDYRDESGTYDRIVSVEMLEAVGEAYWPGYFETLRARLKPGGRAVLQVITIAAEQYDGYRRAPDFIQRHIFPGGMLPTKAVITSLARRAGLEPGRVFHFGSSYARTLADWRMRFVAAWPRLTALGFDARFRRLWDYYLAYCEAGFAAGYIDVGLYELRG